MKTTFVFVLAVLFTEKISAQGQLQLDVNNVSATLRHDGTFFSDPVLNIPGYEIPKNSGNHVAYITTFWLAGIEADSTVHTACNTFPPYFDMFPGPISDNYNSGYYTSTFGNSIWKVTRDQINFHVSNYGATGYIPDPSIASWPGNGNVSEGVADQLAPYIDVDNDQIYDPMAGDFPYIQGDEAVYLIMNDEADTHSATGGNAFGVEIHAMFYQFQAAAHVDNTTFLNAKIFNRRDTNYVDFMFGIWMDSDIGNYSDDYAGSDSIRSLIYGYNGDSNDEGGNGQPGYGTNVPAFGVQFLNVQAGSAILYNILIPEPVYPNSIYHYMRAETTSGVPFTYGGAPYDFMCTGNPFTGTGWNEASLGNTPGERRLVLSSQGQPLNTGDAICYDLAFIFNQQTGNALENVNELLNTADYIQNFYNTSLQPCNQIFLQTDQPKNDSDFSVYPNPSNGNFIIQISEPAFISVYDMAGNCVTEKFQMNQSGEINLDIESGIYFLHMTNGEKLHIEKIVISH